MVVAAALGGLRVWQNTSRSGSLRAYARGLQEVQGSIFARLSPGSDTNLFALAEDFKTGKISATRFREVARTWERDLAAARDALCPGAAPWSTTAQHCARRPLDPPGPLIQANELIARAFDMYRGVAHLYVLAATHQMRLVDPETDPGRRARLQEHVNALLRDALLWRQRADEIYDAGWQQIQRLHAAWGGEPPSPTEGLPP